MVDRWIETMPNEAHIVLKSSDPRVHPIKASIHGIKVSIHSIKSITHESAKTVEFSEDVV